MMANVLAAIHYARIRGAIERGHVGAPSAMLIYVLGGTVALVG
jgi:hypothetical protein